MIAPIILGLLSGLFAYLAQYKVTQWGLKVSFTLIFLFLGFRYNFGNDYTNYFNTFADLSQYDLFDASENKYHYEVGWVYLNQLFRPFGFFGMTLALAVVNCAVYYRFINKYVPKEYYWIAVLLYVFNPEFMLINASAMRQSIAITLFVYSLDFIYKKDLIRYILCIGLASSFHLSALILFPIYLLGLFNWNLNRALGAMVICIFGSMFFFNESISLYLRQFISIYFEKYEGYQASGSVNTGLGFVYGAGMFSVAVFYSRMQNKELALIFKIAIIGFMLLPLNLLIDLIARVGFYFLPATMVAYPVIAKNMKSPLLKSMFLAVLFTFTAWKCYAFFRDPDNSEHYGSYQTVFSASGWY